MAPIKIGIIGYGFSAKCFHIPFILPNPDLKVHAFLQRAAAPKDKSAVSGWGHCTVDFPEAKHYRTADDFFADPDIDLVIICTHAHEEFIERALTTGKHGTVPIRRFHSAISDSNLTRRQLWSRNPSLPPVQLQTSSLL